MEKSNKRCRPNKSDKETFCAAIKYFKKLGKLSGNVIIDSRSELWKDFLRCLTHASLEGDLGFGYRMWLIHGDMKCNDCFDVTDYHIKKKVKRSVCFNGMCSLPVCMRMTPASAAVAYIDTLFKNPPVSRCKNHEDSQPKCMPSGSQNSDVFLEFKDLSFCVRYFQE